MRLQKLLYNYGLSILDKVEKRTFLILSEEELQRLDIHQFILNLKIPHSSYQIIERFHENDNYNLNWHIDDKQLQKYKIDSNLDLQIISTDSKYKYCLVSHNNKNIIRTIIVYLTSDFQGGELCFVDEEIKPYRGLVVIMDKEVHKVNPLISGKRNALVIKL